MKVRAETIGAGVLLLVAIGYTVYGLRYPLGTLKAPGPGVFPLVIGLLAAVLALLELFEGIGDWRSCLRTGTPVSGGPPAYCVDTFDERRPAILVVALVVYLMVVQTVGFLTTTAVLVVVTSRLMGARDWGRPVALALGTVLVCYVLFTVWLRMSLPTGLLI